jgi:cell division transport system ATP-binding protein
MLQPSADPDAPVVYLDRVGLRYGRAPEVLKDLSFQLRPGSFHFLTGASGAGKTSLLSMIYLANRASRGLVSLFGTDVGAAPRESLPALRRRIGVVFQDMKLIDHLNAFENAALPLRLDGRMDAARRAEVTELLHWVGLGQRLDAHPATLSGGERQRLALARAVINRPDLILADEPTGNIDAAMADRIMGLLLELNRQGATVLVATHDQGLANAAGMPILHLQDGRLDRGRMAA